MISFYPSYHVDGRESGWTLGDGDGQGGLACCISWCHKESDMTERLNWTELWYYLLRSLLNALNIQQCLPFWPVGTKMISSSVSTLETGLQLLDNSFPNNFSFPNVVEFHATYAQTALAKDLRRLLCRFMEPFLCVAHLPVSYFINSSCIGLPKFWSPLLSEILSPCATVWKVSPPESQDGYRAHLIYFLSFKN